MHQYQEDNKKKDGQNVVIHRHLFLKVLHFKLYVLAEINIFPTINLLAALLDGRRTK